MPMNKENMKIALDAISKIKEGDAVSFEETYKALMILTQKELIVLLIEYGGRVNSLMDAMHSFKKDLDNGRPQY